MSACFGWQLSSAMHWSDIGIQAFARIRPGFVQQNSFAALLNRDMRTDSVASGAAWNPVLALLKIWFVQRNSITSLPNRGIRMDSVTSAGRLPGRGSVSIPGLLRITRVPPRILVRGCDCCTIRD
jgi:hypothetical protein